jgi:nuclear pore complex protein Nup50
VLFREFALSSHFQPQILSGKMTKRAPTTTLTHDNWDDEEEQEEQLGEMPRATEDQLKKRVIIAAKRPTIRSKGSDPEKGLFSSFSGFGKTKQSSAAVTAEFGKIAGQFNLFGNSAELTTTPITKNVTDNGSWAQNGIQNGSNDVESPKTPSHSHEARAKKTKEHRNLCQYLKILNESVLNFTQKHLKKNPYLDLTPTFQDYINHYKELEIKFGLTKVAGSSMANAAENGQKNPGNEHIFISSDKKFNVDESKKVTFSIQEQSEPSSKTLFTFGQPEKSVETTPTRSFSFGQLEKNVETSTPPRSFSFGQLDKSAETTTPKVSFSFGQSDKSAETSVSTRPNLSFSFGQSDKTNVATAPGFNFEQLKDHQENKTDEPDDNDNAEYQPPEPDMAPIEEKDAFYSIKCKLFYKSGKDFRERGVGMLYLKPLESGKTQLLIRADTSLGNILLNVAVLDSMFWSRMGKNNVSFVCVPNPYDPKTYGIDESNSPVTFLIRVKTGENADELLEKITKPRNN